MQKNGYFLTHIQRIIRIRYRVNPINPTKIFFILSNRKHTVKTAWKAFRIFFTLLANQRNKVNFNYKRAGRSANHFYN